MAPKFLVKHLTDVIDSLSNDPLFVNVSLALGYTTKGKQWNVLLVTNLQIVTNIIVIINYLCFVRNVKKYLFQLTMS